MNARHFNRQQSSAADFIRGYLRLSAVAPFALLAVGCADLHWHKPGATQAALDQELEQCRQYAWLQAPRELLPTLSRPMMIGADPRGRPIVVQSNQRDVARFQLEQDMTRNCMRGKGYELVPHEKQGSVMATAVGSC